mgnify:CR=1 FL=1
MFLCVQEFQGHRLRVCYCRSGFKTRVVSDIKINWLQAANAVLDILAELEKNIATHTDAAGLNDGFAGVF